MTRRMPPWGVVLAMSGFLLISSCTPDTPSAEILCLEAIGELDASIEVYEELLERAVSEMREPDAVEKLDAIASRYSTLLEELNLREPEIPAEVQRAHQRLVSGVDMQRSAWTFISDGIRLGTPDLIDEGAELITLSRQVISESRLAIPSCSLASD
jgi:hypothetical protein